MYLSRSFKAILVILNHVVAVHIPHHLVTAPRLRPSSDEVAFTPRQSSSTITTSSLQLNTRDDAAENESCKRCRKKCAKQLGYIIDPINCAKCIRCPPGLVPNINGKLCIKPDDTKNDKQERYQEKTKEKKDEYKRFQEQNAEKGKRNKVRRMGRCLPLVAIALGSTIAFQYADEFFDEDYLESLELLSFWPDGFAIEEWKSEDL